MTITISSLLNGIRLDNSDSAVVELGRRVRLLVPQGPRSYCHIVLQGSATLICQDQPPAHLQAGDAALLNHGNQHEIFIEKGAPTFEFDYFRKQHRLDVPPTLQIGKSPAAVRLISTALFFHQGRRVSTSQIVPDMVHLSVNPGPDSKSMPLRDLSRFERACTGAGASALIASLSHTLTVEAVRMSLAQMKASTNTISVNALGIPQIATAWRMINSAPGENWTVEHLASSVGLSRSAFAEKFSSSVGEAPMHYVTRVRMERACALLGEGNLPVSAIARQVGYTSLSTFAREFKRRYGVSPREFGRSARVE